MPVKFYKQFRCWMFLSYLIITVLFLLFNKQDSGLAKTSFSHVIHFVFMKGKKSVFFSLALLALGSVGWGNIMCQSAFVAVLLLKFELLEQTNKIFKQQLAHPRVIYPKYYQSTPSPWLTLLLVLGKNCFNQVSC